MTTLLAELHLEPGFYAGGFVDGTEVQTLHEVIILARGTFDPDKALPLGELQPLVYSEIVRDLSIM